MGELNQGVRDLKTILVDAGRVLRSSWPALVAVFLVGFALRSFFLFAAIQATRVTAWLGQILLPLAPLALLLALVVMLRIAWRSFPSRAERPERFTRQLAEDLRTGTTLMIPFIAVYSSAGLLHEDNLAFLRGILLDEAAHNGALGVDFGRFDWISGPALVVMVLLALAIRWALLVSGLPRRSWRWAALGAYIEALWVATLASALRAPLRDAAAWFQATRIGDLGLTSYRGVVGLLGPLEPIIRTSVSWLAGNLVAIASLVFLPLAWLAIGQTAADVEHDPATSLGPRTPSRWRNWLARTAPVVERARRYRKMAQPAWEPLNDLVTAVRHIFVAGWIPMVSFAVLFFLAGQLRVVVAYLGRLILGPLSYGEFVATKPFVILVELLIYSSVIVALITGAVRLVDAAFARATDSVPAPPGSPMPGSLMPGAPVPGAPMPGSLTPSRPMPGAPTPGSPMPGSPMPGSPVPSSLTPSRPMPAAPMPAGPPPVPAAPMHGGPPVVPVPQPPAPSWYPPGGVQPGSGNTAMPGASHHR